MRTWSVSRSTGLMLAFFAVQAAAEPSRRPAMRVASIAEHQAQCSGKEGWNDPAPPIRIFGNVFDIGTCGITVLLIAGDKGAVIVDGATAQAAPSIIANVEQLGFKASDVKLLLSSHEHLDHAGGLNALQRWTNATMVGTAASKAALESGVTATDDPQRTDGAPEFSGIYVGRTVRDGEMVVLGSLRLTAHATPGHAPGGTSWSWRSCDRTTCHRMVYADSVSPVSADGYRFSRHPAYVATFRASLAKIAALTCDLVITPHPAASDLYERLAGRTALSSTSACASYAAAGRALLDRRLAEERAQTARP